MTVQYINNVKNTIIEVALIVVRLSTQSLTAVDPNGNDIYTMVISTGKASTPTPTGIFHIGHQYSKVDFIGDTWQLKGMKNVMCLTGAGITDNSYCLHPLPPGAGSLGIPRSLGCIRMHHRDAKWLFDRSTVGTFVRIQK